MVSSKKERGKRQSSLSILFPLALSSSTIIIIMVRVFYEPPPYGPKTCLNRTGYGVTGGRFLGKELTERLAKTRQGPLIAGVTLFITAICYIPTSTFYYCYYY
jgi:hypothetical protein